MRSPVGGDVLRVLQESSRVVAAGMPLLEVRRGLVEGEGVVLYPTEQLKDGGRVEVR